MNDERVPPVLTQEGFREMFRRLRPLGRLEQHEKLLARAEAEAPDRIDLSPYRRAVQIARHHADEGDEARLELWVEKSDKAFIGILYMLDQPMISTGTKQRKSLEGLRDEQNRRAKSRRDKRRQLVEAILAETRNCRKGAAAAYVAKVLKEQHGIEVTMATIRSDIRAIRRT